MTKLWKNMQIKKVNCKKNAFLAYYTAFYKKTPAQHINH